jgi:hypothetical protein
MRDAHHSGSYGFTILAQFKVSEPDDHERGIGSVVPPFQEEAHASRIGRCNDLSPVEGCKVVHAP